MQQSALMSSGAALPRLGSTTPSTRSKFSRGSLSATPAVYWPFQSHVNPCELKASQAAARALCTLMW